MSLPIRAECECLGKKTFFQGSEEDMPAYFAWRAQHLGQGHIRQAFREMPSEGELTQPRSRFSCSCGATFAAPAGTSGAEFFKFTTEHRLAGHKIVGEVC
jgi:hypothetical protein